MHVNNVELDSYAQQCLKYGWPGNPGPLTCSATPITLERSYRFCPRLIFLRVIRSLVKNIRVGLMNAWTRFLCVMWADACPVFKVGVVVHRILKRLSQQKTTSKHMHWVSNIIGVFGSISLLWDFFDYPLLFGGHRYAPYFIVNMSSSVVLVETLRYVIVA